MAYGECPTPDPECRYYWKPSVEGGNQDNGCRSDKHHLYGRPKPDMSKLERRFVLKQTVQLCRQEHDQINQDYVHYDLPDEQTMREMLKRRKP